MAKAMTVRELHARMAGYIEDGNGDAVVFAAIDDYEIDVAMQASRTDWTPAEFDLTRANVTGRDAPMLVIRHVASDYD